MGIMDEFISLTNRDINNLWLLQNTDTGVIIDPTTGPYDDTLTITMRTLSVTFESIYKNIASYPNKIDMSNENHIIKKYYLENDLLITVDTIIEENGNLITTIISGDTTLKYPIARITKINTNEIIDTIYEEVK